MPFSSPEERRAYQRAYHRTYVRDKDRRNARRRANYAAYTKLASQHDYAEDPRPPLGVVLEHDFRCQLLSRREFSAAVQGDPPSSYATAYWQTAFRKQAFFERGA